MSDEERIAELLAANNRLKQQHEDANRVMVSRIAGWLRGSDLTKIATELEREFLRPRRGIYVSSKVKHAALWRQLRDLNGLNIISTWIDEAGDDDAIDFFDLWRRCTVEAATCEVLVAYREPGEVFKGAFIEIGAALTAEVPVIAVGLDEFTIGRSGHVLCLGTLTEALDRAERITRSSNFTATH